MQTKDVIHAIVFILLGAGIMLAGIIVSKPSTFISTQYNYPDLQESAVIPKKEVRKR